MNKPDKPGFYWGMSGWSDTWDTIIKVEGEAPYLTLYVVANFDVPSGNLELKNLKKIGPEVAFPPTEG